jgi:phenylpropionate dioxygenase-like ring-hydroxylating dioxygenase large terminal subunit
MKAEQNELLCRTDAGTPMGELFRRYWLPILLSWELPQPDGPQVRVKCLGERMIAFRDTNGRLGLIDEFCAHRGVSLYFGRNEECGLRCPYHGWKYDVTGQCVEVPSEPAESGYCQKIKLKSYPHHEQGGVVWVYMGPAEQQPPFPEYEFATVAAQQTYTSKRSQECNWLQAMEGGIDSSHVSFLHSGALNTDPLFKGSKGNQYNLGDKKPVFEVVESEGGLYIGARRNAETESTTGESRPGSCRASPWSRRADHPTGTSGCRWTTRIAWRGASTTTRCASYRARARGDGEPAST